eukprot:GILK01001887.1.p1 GENE.GILK01001887.1~~GILK01001887.1.p1  ORF type:complete len:319 (-),score=44.64 GILK01001887.1:183-1139(-)
MHTFRKFPAQHDDFIHDVAYDFYGKRLATCSSDQKIKVWDRNSKGNWVCSSEWQAHSGAVWKVAWAHPEFGQVLASCSFDRTVCIWEEKDTGNQASEKASQWTLKATLADSRDSVSDIKFAPQHLGFKLATCSADGTVRIYEATDVMNLSSWPLMEEFESHKAGSNAISWNPSRYEPPMVVIGSNDSVAKVWEYSEQYRRWQVSVELVGHDDCIHDVAWAPNMGRTYHLIATASKDKTVRIWKLILTTGARKYEAQELSVLDQHKAEVWRVEWNITGTVLSSSGDDGTVRLWRSNFQGQWGCVSAIAADAEDEGMQDS